MRQKAPKNRATKVSRRDFVGKATAAVAGFTIVPRDVLGGEGHTPPSERLNIAGIGVHNQGNYDLKQVSSENVVAICDVHDEYSGPVLKRYPKAKGYRDFRRMLERQKDIDAVMIGTPDHTHAVIAMAAMQLGKHVYCQKPMAHDIFEVRKLTEAARNYKVVTQMGIQDHASDAMRTFVEIVQSGVIGKVREVHLWVRKSYPYAWAYTRGFFDRPPDSPAVPPALDWDLWLGPAPKRPYHPAYTPVTWRVWWDFGTGIVGDMGCHIMDGAFWALRLGGSFTVEATSSTFNDEMSPLSSILRYQFPARGELPPVTITWYDGGMMPWRPSDLEQGRDFPRRGGLYIGDKGKIFLPFEGGPPQFVPRREGFEPPAPSLPRGVSHYEEWVRGCKGGPKPLASFDYTGPLTEMVLMGNVALRAGERVPVAKQPDAFLFPRRKLTWDGPNLRVTNVPEANEYLRREYRKGWTL
jgi:predicted dehydrogenase